MVTVGYNPTTKKVQYNASTGKVCVGCCEEFGSNCTHCPTPSQTPLSITIVLADLVQCDCVSWDQANPSPCEPFFSSNAQLTPDIISSINGTHVLTQTTSCVWRKTISLSNTLSIYDWEGSEPEDPCDTTPCFSSTDSQIQFVVQRFNSTTAIFFIRGPNDLTTLFQQSITCGTSTECPFCKNTEINLTSCGSKYLFGGGTIERI